MKLHELLAVSTAKKKKVLLLSLMEITRDTEEELVADAADFVRGSNRALMPF